MLGVAVDIGHQEPADWAAFIKRDLEGIVSVRAIKSVAESKIQKAPAATRIIDRSF
jgi:hypothetical protein